MRERDRTASATEIKRAVIDALARGEEPQIIAEALFDAIPELVDRRCAHAHVERIYDKFHRERRELEGSTEPFVRVA